MGGYVSGGGGSGTDAFTVKVDSGATAGYIGAASTDGVLRTGAPLSYTDGGDYVTLGFTWPSMTVTAKTDDYAVLAADFGINKALSMSAAGLKTFTLPSVAAGDIGKVITFIKLGAGQVTIDAADSDTIHDSSAGGTLTNAQAGETYATVTLMLTSATTWNIIGISGIGWVTT